MILRTTQAADAVLSVADMLSQEEDTLTLQPYQNGREHGWTLIKDRRQVAFAEYRNSDNIVVYDGGVMDFSPAGNVPSREIWVNRTMFRHDEIYEAARFVLHMLRKEVDTS